MERLKLFPVQEDIFWYPYINAYDFKNKNETVINPYPCFCKYNYSWEANMECLYMDSEPLSLGIHLLSFIQFR